MHLQEPLAPYISPSLHLPLGITLVLLGLAMSAYLCVYVPPLVPSEHANLLRIAAVVDWTQYILVCRYETAHSNFGKSVIVEGSVAMLASVMLVCASS